MNKENSIHLDNIDTLKESNYVMPIRVAAKEFIPIYSSQGASGADIKARLSAPYLLAPQERIKVPTGIWIEIPMGYEIQIRPRSGLSFEYGVCLLNSPGTIDADYRGEICVLLINLGNESFTLLPGMRVAQIVVASVQKVHFLPTSQPFSQTERGEKGFGHTGYY